MVFCKDTKEYSWNNLNKRRSKIPILNIMFNCAYMYIVLQKMFITFTHTVSNKALWITGYYLNVISANLPT